MAVCRSSLAWRVSSSWDFNSFFRLASWSSREDYSLEFAVFWNSWFIPYRDCSFVSFCYRLYSSKETSFVSLVCWSLTYTRSRSYGWSLPRGVESRDFTIWLAERNSSSFYSPACYNCTAWLSLSWAGTSGIYSANFTFWEASSLCFAHIYSFFSICYFISLFLKPSEWVASCRVYLSARR